MNHAPENLALVALGSNMGDSIRLIHSAFNRLQELSMHPLRRSSLWRTTPVDCPPGSPLFVNAAAALVPREGETPESLMRTLGSLEAVFGRRPKTVLNEPRPLDLDLIAFAGETWNSSSLTVPHPRAHLRRFVLQPLSEVAPDFILPGQTRTICELLRDLASTEQIERI